MWERKRTHKKAIVRAQIVRWKMLLNQMHSLAHSCLAHKTLQSHCGWAFKISFRNWLNQRESERERRERAVAMHRSMHGNGRLLRCILSAMQRLWNPCAVWFWLNAAYESLNSISFSCAVHSAHTHACRICTMCTKQQRMQQSPMLAIRANELERGKKRRERTPSNWIVMWTMLNAWISIKRVCDSEYVKYVLMLWLSTVLDADCIENLIQGKENKKNEHRWCFWRVLSCFVLTSNCIVGGQPKKKTIGVFFLSLNSCISAHHQVNCKQFVVYLVVFFIKPPPPHQVIMLRSIAATDVLLLFYAILYFIGGF